jgi:ferredoxin
MDTAVALGAQGLQHLLAVLNAQGFTIIGPTLGAAAITLGRVTSIGDLPLGWTDRQTPGSYALTRSGSEGFFQYTCGPHTWKTYLYPPETILWCAREHGGDIRMEARETDIPSYAFVGLRPCDLRSLGILDRVLADQVHCDPYYRECRRRLFTVVVNCLQPGGTCFCSTVGGAPATVAGCDIILSESIEGPCRTLVAEPASRRGAEVLEATGSPDAARDTIDNLRRMSDRAAAMMHGASPGLPPGPDLQQCFDDPHWSTLELRCLACGNCTLVCPTCFCHGIRDTGSLDGSLARRTRIQDSCFNLAFSYIHGGSVRATVAGRYRQWLLHKLAFWQDQFGTSGCVGCGRCITWCPAGIDLRREAGALAGDQHRPS